MSSVLFRGVGGAAIGLVYYGFAKSRFSFINPADLKAQMGAFGIACLTQAILSDRFNGKQGKYLLPSVLAGGLALYHPSKGGIVLGLGLMAIQWVALSWNGINTVSTPLKEKAQGGSIQPIAQHFTTDKTLQEQQEAHEVAKQFLREKLSETADVQFISSPSTLPICPLGDVQIDKTSLWSSVFSAQYTTGVLGDIIKDGQRPTDEEIGYTVASQFTGAESPRPYTVLPGQAAQVYKRDLTQGPQAQLAFGTAQVETLNDAANLAFNGLIKLLSGETKSAVKHGYLMPNRTQAPLLIEQLQQQGQLIEYPCIGSVPLNGQVKVYQLLVSTIALGGYSAEANRTNPATRADQQTIQFLCALHAYRAQFEWCLQQASTTRKRVILKAAAIGVGAYDNNPNIVATGFYQAAMEYQKQLKAANVQVILQVFKRSDTPDPKAQQMADALGLNVSNELCG